MVKVGNQLFTAEGPSVVRELARMGFGIFLDLKFHDIPNTVSHGIASACRLPGVRLLTLHTLGAAEMMLAARRAADAAKHPPKLLGVTLLTSHDEASIRQRRNQGTGIRSRRQLGKLAKEARLDGVVSSAREVRAIRRAVRTEDVDRSSRDSPGRFQQRRPSSHRHARAKPFAPAPITS